MYEQVINYITNHGSAEHPVSNAKISKHFDTSETNIRKYINKARCEGIPICSSNHGYYYSEDKADIVETIHSLNRRTIAVEKAISGLLTNLMRGTEVKDNELN